MMELEKNAIDFLVISRSVDGRFFPNVAANSNDLQPFIHCQKKQNHQLVEIAYFRPD